jgi:hypothetical protein
MKNPESVIIFTLLISAFTLVGCEQPLYRAKPESVQVKNDCSFNIFVQFDSVNFNRGYDFMDKSMIYSINPDIWTYPMWIKFKKYNLIMHDSTFSRISSTIKIYRIVDGDTSRVNPDIYNKRAAWETTLYKHEWDMHYQTVVVNYFNVEEWMFQN